MGVAVASAGSVSAHSGEARAKGLRARDGRSVLLRRRLAARPDRAAVRDGLFSAALGFQSRRGAAWLGIAGLCVAHPAWTLARPHNSVSSAGRAAACAFVGWGNAGARRWAAARARTWRRRDHGLRSDGRRAGAASLRNRARFCVGRYRSAQHAGDRDSWRRRGKDTAARGGTARRLVRERRPDHQKRDARGDVVRAGAAPRRASLGRRRWLRVDRHRMVARRPLDPRRRDRTAPRALRSAAAQCGDARRFAARTRRGGGPSTPWTRCLRPTPCSSAAA